MAYPTFSDIVQEVQTAISLVSGTSVQVYAEDRIALMVQTKFNSVFDELWWPKYMRYFERSLDGSQGVVTTSLEDIKQYEDIAWVCPFDSDERLPELSSAINPTRLTGTRTRFISPYVSDDEVLESTRVVQLWPKTAENDIVLFAKARPDPFTQLDPVKMDKDLLVAGAAYAYVMDDGTNPGATEKFQIEFETRLKQLKRLHSSKPVPIRGMSSQWPTEWFTYTP